MIGKLSIIAVFLCGFALAPGEIPSTAGWYEIPNTALTSVAACTHGFPGVCGVMGSVGLFNWSGGALDTKRNRLIILGGGHNDYFGNELYALSLDSLNIRRITDPGSTPITYGYQSCPEAIANGTQPNSRHTYDGVAYIEHVDRLFIYSGALACGFGYTARDTWTFDFATSTWHRMTSSGTLPAANYGVVCDYDPNTKKVFLHDNSAFYSYSFETDSYTKLADNSLGYHMTCVIDPKRKKFVMFGNDATGTAFVYDIGGTNYTRSTLNTTGATAIIGQQYPGLAYDPVSDKIVAWNGGNTVYSLDMDTKVWTATTYTGGPGPANETGTFKRWRYSAKEDAFIVANQYNGVIQNGYTFRFPGTGTEQKPSSRLLNNLSISPNPASGVIRISLRGADNQAKVAIFDLQGRKIADIAHSMSDEFRWETAKAKSGVYLVRARAGRNVVEKRVTVIR